MTAQLSLAETCPACGRPVRLLSAGGRFLLAQMRAVATIGAPADVLADMRARARELEAAFPGFTECVRCHLGLCRSPGAGAP